MNEMKQRKEKILKQIEEACLKFHRNVNEVKLLAVSKKQSLSKLKEMVSLGQKSLGENYVQELLQKQEELSDLTIDWHLIGTLQSNKVSKIIGKLNLIPSVLNLKLAKIISEKAKENDIVQNVLLQINTSGEASKSGMDLKDSQKFIREALTFSNIKVLGLMTMPPFTDDGEDSRPHFQILRKLRDEFKDSGVVELSMGTTQDFEIAIQEGATIIRVGEALFGPREAPLEKIETEF